MTISPCPRTPIIASPPVKTICPASPRIPHSLFHSSLSIRRQLIPSGLHWLTAPLSLRLVLRIDSFGDVLGQKLSLFYSQRAAMNVAFLIFLMIYRVNAQYEPQSNIDRLAQRPILPQCPREWEWACRNGECIAHYDVCDGIQQCTDGSDEWNCDSARGVAPLAREGIAAPREKELVAAAAAPITTTSTVASVASGTVTIQYSHILLALAAFVVLSVAVVTLIRKRARQKTGFRNRRGHNILQQDSDEDDILISSMYS